jgi:DNA-binding LacI/PurR family transcriptional regulator
MKPQEPITIRDLASRLGVTHSTVSRALSPGSGRSRVSPKTRARIESLARELGYRPNAVARNLVSRRTRSIGVIVRHLNDPFASNLVQDIHLNLTRLGYLGMFFSARDAAEFDHALDSSLSRRVDGILSVTLQPAEQTKVERLGVPIVYYGNSGPRASSVGVEPLQGMRLAMAHLVEQGHRKIGYIGPTDRLNPRFRGFLQGVARHGLPTEPAWVREVAHAGLRVSVDGVFEAGCRQMAALLELPNRPTATICHNDVMAIGALRALSAAGLNVPGGMALIGFDNLREGEFAAVPLTTVDPHLDRIARLLTETLIRQVEKQPNARTPVRIRIEPTLVVRESTGPSLARPIAKP